MSHEKDLLEILAPWYDDPDIVEILIDGYDTIYFERKGQFEDVPSPFQNEAHLRRAIDELAQKLGCALDAAQPLIDLRLDDNSRLNIVLPPIAINGPTVTLRKFAKTAFTFDDLIGFGSISEPIVQFLAACIKGRLNIAVTGGTGSGKTTVMNMLSAFIPETDRVITVEHVAEMELRHKRLVRLESRQPDRHGEGGVTVTELVINAMKMRPDRIVLGEVRGAEMLDFTQAMNTGYDGSMLTLHANSPRDVLARLETMIAMSDISVPLLTIRQQLATALDVITHQELLPDGTRKLMKVTEVVGMQGDGIELRDIFEFRRTGMENGRIQGAFTATGYIPSFLGKLHDLGLALPVSLFSAR